MSQPASTDTDLWVSWEDYNRLIERLALQVYESGWKFDVILCLARGGVRVGDVLSRIFDVPLGILATSSYREAAGTRQGNLDIARFITITRGAPPVVAYCRGSFCVMAHDAVRILGGEGIDARRLEDGMLEWRAAGLPVAAGTS